MNLQEDNEMTDEEIRIHYGNLINKAATAFSIQANYAEDIVKKAHVILARQAKRAK